MLKRTKHADNSAYIRNGGCYMYHYRFVEDNDSGTEADGDVEPLSLDDDLSEFGKNIVRLRRIYDKMAPKRPFPAFDPKLFPPVGVQTPAPMTEAKSHESLALGILQDDRSNSSSVVVDAANEPLATTDAHHNASAKSSVATGMGHPATDHEEGASPSVTAYQELTSENVATLDSFELDDEHAAYFAADDMSAYDTDIEYSDDGSDTVSEPDMSYIDESYVILPQSPYLKPHSCIAPEEIPKQVVVEKLALLTVLPIYQNAIFNRHTVNVIQEETGLHRTPSAERRRIVQRLEHSYANEARWGTTFRERLEYDTYGRMSDLDVVYVRAASLAKIVGESYFERAKAIHSKIYDDELTVARAQRKLQHRALVVGCIEEMDRRRRIYASLQSAGIITKDQIAAGIRKKQRVLMARRLAVYSRRAHNTVAAIPKNFLAPGCREICEFPALSEDDIFPTAVNEAMRIRDYNKPYRYPEGQPRPHYPPKPRPMPTFTPDWSDLDKYSDESEEESEEAEEDEEDEEVEVPEVPSEESFEEYSDEPSSEHTESDESSEDAPAEPAAEVRVDTPGYVVLETAQDSAEEPPSYDAVVEADMLEARAALEGIDIDGFDLGGVRLEDYDLGPVRLVRQRRSFFGSFFAALKAAKETFTRKILGA